MDLRQIGQEDLGCLAGMYMHGTFLFGQGLEEASARKQRRFRKWVMKQYTDRVYELSEAAWLYIDKDVADRDFVGFLAACHKEMQRRLEEKNAAQRQLLSELDEETAAALELLLEGDEWIAPRMLETAMELTVDENAAYRRQLILEDATGEGYQEGIYLSVPLRLEKVDGRYVLSGRVDIADVDLRISFSRVKVRVDCFDPVHSVPMEDPWRYLSQLAHVILEKLRLPGNYGNETEQSLIPLLVELEGLGESGEHFALLAQIAASHGLQKEARVLKNAKAGNQYWLMRRLCDSRCEEMWRWVFDQIRSSQDGYIKAVDALCDREQLTRERRIIQAALEKMGYTGSWPLFEKRGRVDGLHVAAANDQSYFIFREKNVVFRILCVENCHQGQPLCSFLAGTAFLRAKEEAEDIYSCMFDKKGRRLSFYVTDSRWYTLETKTEDLERTAQAAAKKAELRKLSKEERELCCATDGTGVGLFFWVLLVMGGLFGIFMTLGFMLITVLLALVFGAAGEIPGLMASMPWWQIFVFAWVAFGVSMGIVEVLAMKNCAK